MTRRKPPPATINDGYKQTDISIYFKVTNRASWNTKMLSTTNKENDSEEPLLSPRKNPKPICSDDETELGDGEDVVAGPVWSLKNGLPPASTQLPKPVLRENRYPQQCSLSKLPLQLPVYTYSDDSDSEEHSRDKPLSQLLDTENRCRTKVPTPGSSQPITPKNSPIKAGIKKNLKIKPIVVISSDDEDFEVTPRKVRKVEDTLLHRRKLTQQETTTKVKQYIASNIIPNVCNRLYQSVVPNNTTCEQEKEKLEDATILILGPSTSKATPEVISHTIGVHKPTTVPKTIAKPKPQILLEKNKSNPNLPSISSEFISIDFSTKTAVEVLSTTIETISSNETIVYEQNTNFVIRENINSTPKKVKVLENVLISNPVRTLDQCDLSPIKKVPRTEKEEETKQSISFASSREITKNTQDVTNTNSSSVAKEQFETSNWTTRLFTKVVKYIVAHSHLKTMLTGTESDTLNRFFSMPQAEYQFFCFKLFTRIQKWYNIFKLRDELRMQLSDPEMKNLYDCLFENRFVEIDFSMESCNDLLNLLLVRDLKDICETFKIKLTNEKKCEIIQKLLANCSRQATLTTKSTEKILREKIKQKMGICVKLSSALYKLFNKVHLLYTFTTSDFATPSDLHFYLGRIMSNEIYMPKYKVNMNVKVFSSINQFSRFEEACECKRAMMKSYEKKEIGHMLELGELAYTELRQILECNESPKPSYMMRFTAGYKYTKTLSLGAKHLARHYPQEVEEWLTFLIEQDQYCLKLRGTWYDWLVMVQYQYLKQFETAANTLIEALEQRDLSKVSLQDLNYRAEAIKRSKARKISELMHDKICFVQLPPLREWPSVEIDAQVIHNDSGKKGKRLYIKKTVQGQQIRTVEETALDYYFKHGYPNGFHCEGSLLKTLLFVLFWDIIYESAVVDAFILEIQYYPLDLMSPEFYTNRKEAIDRRLDEIQSLWPYDQLKSFMCKIWNEHAHEKSFIDDRLIDESKDLYDIVICIGRVKLACMLERIIKDFKAYHSGLPDLFVWSVNKQKCKFVEVKGERDSLSSKQKLWLDFLLSVGADAEVCHVHTMGSRTGRKVGKLKKEVKKQEK